MIPKIIHQIWVGGPVPSELVPCIDSWKNLHSQWDHYLWSDGDLEWLHNQKLFDNAADYVPDHAVGQFKADIARYEILYHYGGVYVDADFEALHPIDDLVDNVEAFSAEQPIGDLPANSIIGVQPYNETMKKCIDKLFHRAHKYRNTSAARISGPKLFGPFAKQDTSFTIYSADWFFPYSWKDVEQNQLLYSTESCYAVHHWYHRRTMFDRPLE